VLGRPCFEPAFFDNDREAGLVFLANVLSPDGFRIIAGNLSRAPSMMLAIPARYVGWMLSHNEEAKPPHWPRSLPRSEYAQGRSPQTLAEPYVNRRAREQLRRHRERRADANEGELAAAYSPRP